MLTLLKDNKFIYKTYNTNRTIVGIDQVISDNSIFTYAGNKFHNCTSTTTSISSTSTSETMYIVESLQYPTCLYITGSNGYVKYSSIDLNLRGDSGPMFDENHLLVIVPPNLETTLTIYNMNNLNEINSKIDRYCI